MTQVDAIRQLDPGLRRDDERKKAGMTRGGLVFPPQASPTKFYNFAGQERAQAPKTPQFCPKTRRNPPFFAIFSPK